MATALTLPMSIAAGIEIATGGRPESEQTAVRPKGLGEAQSAEWTHATAASSSSSSVPGAESFRSSWQSVLASLGAGLGGHGNEETGADGISTSIESALARAGRTAPSRTSTLLSGAELPWQPGRGAQGEPVTRGAMLAKAGSQTEVSALQAASGAAQHTAVATPTGKSQANVKPAKSEFRAHQPNSEKSAKLEIVSGGTADLPVPPTGGSIPQTDLSAGLPTRLTRETAHPPPSQTEGPGSAAGRKSAAGNQAADAAGAAPKRGIASSDPDTATTAAGPSALTDRALDETEAFNPEGAPSSTSSDAGSSAGRIRSQAEEPIHALTQSHAPVQAEPGGSGLEAVAASSTAEGTDPGSTMTAALQSSSSPAFSSIGGRPDLGHGMRASGPSALRPGSAEPGQHGNRPEGGQPAAAVLDASALARDPAGDRMPVTAAGDMVRGSADSSAGPSARETFTALDAETASGAPAWTHAGARGAEAGFQDPALGWIGVRANMSGAGIRAALVPGSADAAEALGGHLAGLNTYLAEQHTPVETLTLAAPEDHSAAPTMDQSGNQGMYQGAGQHAGQGTPSDTQTRTHSSMPAIAAASPHASAAAAGPEIASMTARPGGVHISVMA